jgi:hypothetical protein
MVLNMYHCNPVEMERMRISFENEVVIIYTCNGTKFRHIIMDDTIDADVMLSRGHMYDTETESVYPDYWNWPIPIVIVGNYHKYIISSHGESYIEKSDRILQSMIVPCPRTLYHTHLSINPNMYHIQHINEGAPILFDGRKLRLMSNVLDKSPWKDIVYAISHDMNSISNSSTYIRSSTALLRVYVHSRKDGYHWVEPSKESNKSIWLYGDTISYLQSSSLDELLWNLREYLHTRFTSIPLQYHDISIIC